MQLGLGVFTSSTNVCFLQNVLMFKVVFDQCTFASQGDPFQTNMQYLIWIVKPIKMYVMHSPKPLLS